MGKKSIDEYFRMDLVPTEEPAERRSSVRRVSFAPEPPVVYESLKSETPKLPQNKTPSTTEPKQETKPEEEDHTSSSEVKSSEIKSTPVDPGAPQSFNFIMDDDSEDDTLPNKRMSICTGEVEGPSMEQTLHEYTVDLPVSQEKEGIVSDMLSEIICADENHTLVYDTVNVEEVLHKYDAAKKRDAKKIKDVLAEAGIRFLDNLSLSNRRETLSKIRNTVQDHQVLYYREYLQRRISMQNVFSARLVSEIESLRAQAEALEAEITAEDIDGICDATESEQEAPVQTGSGSNSRARHPNPSVLRHLKSDARRRGKSSWHALRLEREQDFAQEVRRALDELNEAHKKEKEKLEKTIELVSQIDIPGEEKQEKELAKSLARLSLSAPEQAAKALALSGIDDDKIELSVLLQQRQELAAKKEKVGAEAAELAEKLRKARAELLEADRALDSAEVQKETLAGLKDTVQRTETVLGLRVTQASNTHMSFSLSGVSVSIFHDTSFFVTRASAVTDSDNVLTRFAAASVEHVVSKMGQKKSVAVCAEAICLYVLEMFAIEKEVMLAGVSLPYEVHGDSEELRIQFMLRKGKTGTLATVTATLKKGSVHPEITSNIRGFTPGHRRYGNITKSLEVAKRLARLK